MPITNLHLGRVYKFEGKNVVVTREWDAETHRRVMGHFVEGQLPFHHPKLAFMEAAEEVLVET